MCETGLPDIVSAGSGPLYTLSVHSRESEAVAKVKLSPVVTEVKRLAIEFDEIEKPGNFTETRYNKLKTDVRAAGEELHKLDGVDLMKSTLEWYVPKTASLHGCFDRGFDGIGEWVS